MTKVHLHILGFSATSCRLIISVASLLSVAHRVVQLFPGFTSANLIVAKLFFVQKFGLKIFVRNFLRVPLLLRYKPLLGILAVTFSIRLLVAGPRQNASFSPVWIDRVSDTILYPSM